MDRMWRPNIVILIFTDLVVTIMKRVNIFVNLNEKEINMNKLFAILWMIFFHVIADYNLQGWLASAKQKSYWEENAPDKKYRHDYIMALIMHSISWTFMIMLPVAYMHDFNISYGFLILFAVNVLAHAIVDDTKANQKSINLWEDQLFHMIQIMTTAGAV